MDKNLLCLDDVTNALVPICRNARKRGAFSTVRIENHVADKNAVDLVTYQHAKHRLAGAGLHRDYAKFITEFFVKNPPATKPMVFPLNSVNLKTATLLLVTMIVRLQPMTPRETVFRKAGDVAPEIIKSLVPLVSDFIARIIGLIDVVILIPDSFSISAMSSGKRPIIFPAFLWPNG